MSLKRLGLAVGLFFLLAAFEQKEGEVRESPELPSVEDIIERGRQMEMAGVFAERIIEVSGYFTWSDFLALRASILAGGKTALLGNAYPPLPYADFGDYRIWLLPRHQFIPDIEDPEIYIGIVIRDYFHHPVGSQYYYLKPLPDQAGTLLELHCDTAIPDELIVDNLRLYLAEILPGLRQAPVNRE